MRRRVGLTAALAIGAGFLAGLLVQAVRPVSATSNPIRADQFVLVDSKGTERAFLGLHGDNQEYSVLILRDPEGRKRFQLTVSPNERKPRVAFLSPTGELSEGTVDVSLHLIGDLQVDGKVSGTHVGTGGASHIDRVGVIEGSGGKGDNFDDLWSSVQDLQYNQDQLADKINEIIASLHQ